jgi:hypothetical protein
MDVKVRVRGVDTHIRDMVKLGIITRESARQGVLEAAKYLLTKIQAKFGKYNSTGGGGQAPSKGGPWAKLKFESIKRKIMKYGSNRGPLIGSGEMMNSFTVVEASTKQSIAASVGSDDPKLVHHVYGAPGANVPRRDPVFPTAVEEKEKCHDIIEKYVTEGVRLV